MDIVENAIEFISGQHFATVTFSNQKHINKIKKLYSDHSDEFKYFKENKDGSICCKIPLKWIKVSYPKQVNRVYTEEEKEKMRERLAKARKKL